MEPIQSSLARSQRFATPFQCGDKMQSHITQNLDNSNSFTALLGLPANEALELLHQTESGKSLANYDLWKDQQQQQQQDQTLGFVFNCSPTFHPNAALVERAARFSIFAGSRPEESMETSTDPSNCSDNSHKLAAVKIESADSDSNPNPGRIFTDPANQKEKRPIKRKEKEINKVKGSVKRSKSLEGGKSKSVEQPTVDQGSGIPEKLPYVHVRARRGQATDSHSLAERARREKINARMKLLQELVPGCSKISGTALVLDEIINHVQSLQRQVEFLSMRLAAVNPRFDFGVESFLSGESSCLTATNGVNIWPDVQVNGPRRQNHQQLWQMTACGTDLAVPSIWGRDHSHGFIGPDASILGIDSASSVSLRPNQLKMEL